MNHEFLWASSLAAVVAVGYVIWRLSTAERRSVEASGANSRLAGNYYAPLARLLSESDLDGLTAVGVPRGEMRRFRAARRKVFRKYLTDLQCDFRVVHAEARELLRDSTTDRPDLAVDLVKRYADFQIGVVFAHVRLTAHALGVRPMDVEALLGPATWMRQQAEMLRSPAA